MYDPSQCLLAVQQKGPMARYIHEFEDLSSQISGLTDGHLEEIFIMC